VTEKFPPANPQGSERTDEVVRVGEEFLASLGIVDENTDIAEGATSKISDDGSFHFFSDEPGGSNHPTANADAVKETSGIDKDDIKIIDDSSEDEGSQNETLTCSSNSDSDSDYDESMEQLHDELTREEMARLKALESAPPIKIFDDLAGGATRKLLEDDLFSDVPVDSNHPINTQSEGIAVQA
jgi:hypothetical protein